MAFVEKVFLAWSN